MKRHELYHLSRDDIVYLSEQYIHNHRYRAAFIDRYCDGYSVGEVAERNDYTYRHTQDILYECMKDILSHI